MKNIFVSRPNSLDNRFEKSHLEFEKFLRKNSFEPMTLGRNAYSLETPLGAVIKLIKSCQGAIILGYPQLKFSTQVINGDKVTFDNSIILPTPWNQIEATLAYHAKLPILVIAHTGIVGGIFDHGVLGKFIFCANLSNPNWFREKDKIKIFELWKKEVTEYE